MVCSDLPNRYVGKVVISAEMVLFFAHISLVIIAGLSVVIAFLLWRLNALILVRRCLKTKGHRVTRQLNRLNPVTIGNPIPVADGVNKAQNYWVVRISWLLC